MTVKERLLKFIANQGLSQGRFEKLSGLSNGYVNALKRNPGTDKLQSILGAFPNLNGEWLMTGNGEMLRDERTSTNENEKIIENQVPLIPASAFAGKVEGFAPDSVSLAECEYVNTPVKGAEMAIPITGDSMEPDYPDGSIAYISRINEHAFIPWGHTVILDTENGAFIKRIYPDNEDDDFVWAKSINPAYPPMHIPKASIFRMFRMLAVSRIFTTM